MTNLIPEINNLNTIIKDSLLWVDSFLANDIALESREKFISARRKINRIKYALNLNPSVVVYGESQVGKSYLVRNLLSVKGQEFCLSDNDSNSYNFLEEINPRGEDKESTSLVTRFTTSLTVPEPSYPILIRLLNSKDLALLLIDSCFSEIGKRFKPLSIDEINSLVDSLIEDYSSSKVVQHNLIEDDLLDIKDYLTEYFPNYTGSQNIQDSKYWNSIPKIISKIPSDQWHKVIGILWANNTFFNDLFKGLVESLKMFDFANEVYCNFDAVVRKYGTLLNVTRLKQIVEEDYDRNQQDAEEFKGSVDIYCNGNLKNIDKSQLCAITQEIVFKLDDKLVESKPFLKSFDILDFPGAQPRDEIELDTLKQNLGLALLRGKVAYLFNKYSSHFLINNLLFCYHKKDVKATYLKFLLDTWVRKYVGETKEERSTFLQSNPISPLFFIATKFNLELKRNEKADKNENNLIEKWSARYDTHLEEQLLLKKLSEEEEWHSNWSNQSKYFNNHYNLRDFFWSNNSQGGMYQGYDMKKNLLESSKIIPEDYDTYWEDLKKTYLNFKFVKNHFLNPEESWSETTDLNKDGSELIIRDLSKAADVSIRLRRFTIELKAQLNTVIKAIKRHYHNEEKDNSLFTAMEKAGQLQLSLDLAFGKDPYFFSELIKSLLVSEGEIYNFYKERIKDIELVEETNLEKYIALRGSNLELSPSKSFEENLDVLVQTYKADSRESMQQSLKEDGVDLNELFYGENKRIKSNSEVLAESLENYWIDTYLQVERFEHLKEVGLSQERIQDLLDNIRVNFSDRIGVSDIIAKYIRSYVDRYDKISRAEEMIADISASVINNFVTSMGYEYNSLETIEKLKDANKKNDLGLNFDLDFLEHKPIDEAGLNELFETMDNLHIYLNETPIDKDKIKNVPSYSHFSKWTELMKVSFAACQDIPTYDPIANKKLGEILKNAKKCSFENVALD